MSSTSHVATEDLPSWQHPEESSDRLDMIGTDIRTTLGVSGVYGHPQSQWDRLAILFPSKINNLYTLRFTLLPQNASVEINFFYIPNHMSMSGYINSNLAELQGGDHH